MSMQALHELRAMVHAYQDFSECVVSAIALVDFGTTVVVSIDYIWKGDGSVRSDDEPRVVAHLRFGLVENLIVRNALKPETLSDPTTIGWGLAELARVEIIPLAETTVAGGVTAPAYRCVLWREEGPWIDITFATLEVGESVEPGP